MAMKVNCCRDWWRILANCIECAALYCAIWKGGGLCQWVDVGVDMGGTGWDYQMVGVTLLLRMDFLHFYSDRCTMEWKRMEVMCVVAFDMQRVSWGRILVIHVSAALWFRLVQFITWTVDRNRVHQFWSLAVCWYVNLLMQQSIGLASIRNWIKLMVSMMIILKLTWKYSSILIVVWKYDSFSIY